MMRKLDDRLPQPAGVAPPPPEALLRDLDVEVARAVATRQDAYRRAGALAEEYQDSFPPGLGGGGQLFAQTVAAMQSGAAEGLDDVDALATEMPELLDSRPRLLARAWAAAEVADAARSRLVARLRSEAFKDRVAAAMEAIENRAMDLLSHVDGQESHERACILASTTQLIAREWRLLVAVRMWAANPTGTPLGGPRPEDAEGGRGSPRRARGPACPRKYSALHP